MPLLADMPSWLGPQALWVALWAGLGTFTVVLLLLLHTRLGRSKPLQKCTILALWFHLLLLIYAASVQITAERPGHGNQVTINLATGEAAAAETPAAPDQRIFEFVGADSPAADVAQAPPGVAAPRADTAAIFAAKPERTAATSPAVARLTAPVAADVPDPTIDLPSREATPAKTSAAIPRTEPKRAATAPRVTQQTKPAAAQQPTTERPTTADAATTAQPAALSPSNRDALVKTVAPAELNDIPDPTASLAAPVPSPAAVDPARPNIASENITRVPPLVDLPTTIRPAVALPATSPDATASVAARGSSATSPATAAAHQPPPIYQQRVATDRERVAAAHGGSNRTEAAVNAALKWLAAGQEADGRWNPARFGAGQEAEILGHNRGGAGAKADTGITGLALLAFLGAGHTNTRGDYQATVAAALDYLIATQHPNGNLGGNAEPFAFMYCHGMATLALSEALAMTGDDKLREPVRRAIGYTLAAQNRVTGGWRYRPNDSGDLSQLGWQLMALKSAELAGIDIPHDTREGMLRFVHAVSSGEAGGLASYRAGEQVSVTMTAEALVCKQFLGMSRQNPAGDEAGNFLLSDLPGRGPRNYYYWYYGTLGMYQLQGEHWRRWNEAISAELVAGQVQAGDMAGSWEANDLWGGYGGRVYSTALATLCLEVYYRYLPLYVEAAANGGEVLRK